MININRYGSKSPSNLGRSVVVVFVVVIGGGGIAVVDTIVGVVAVDRVVCRILPLVDGGVVVVATCINVNHLLVETIHRVTYPINRILTRIMSTVR